MDPYQLAERIERTLPGCGSLDDPRGALGELEAAAAAAPADRALASAIPRLAERIAVEERAPAVVAGVRREALVRWDDFSVTFRGARLTDGAPALARVLRPEAARDPVLRRHLAREGRALRAVLPVELDDEGLRLPLSGHAAGPARGGALARALGTGLAALLRWERAGLGLPPPTPDELRVGPDASVGIAGLTAVEPGGPDALAALARALVSDDDEGELAQLARGLAAAPPALDDAAARLRRTWAAALAAQRHDLARRWRAGAHHLRHARLGELVARLERAVPPPGGRGAVGVDLEGRITVVETRGQAVVWGPEGGAEVVYDGDGFRAPTARRLLRARAASPPNATLDARVGGDAERVEAICRWVAAGLQLRTVKLLLEKEPR